MTSQPPFLPTSIFLPQEFEQMLIRLNTFLNQVCLYMNQREVSNYLPIEIQTGQTWNSPTNASQRRPGFRKVFFFEAIPAGTVLTIPHEINNLSTITHWLGSVETVLPDFRPIPYASIIALDNQIEVVADNANIYIANGAGGPDIVSGIITLEYLRN